MKNIDDIEKIRVLLEDKRDFVLSNKNISDDNIRELVSLFDDLMDLIELSYDNIIKNKSINKNNIGILDKMIDKILLAKENMNE